MINVYDQLFTEDDAKAAYDVVKSGILSSFGPKTIELEDRFKKWTGRKFSLACSNGTAALSMALCGLNVTNDRVAVPACSFAATAYAALEQHNRVEFIDVDRSTWNMNMEKLEEACTKWLYTDPIKCVIAVHNLGNPYDYDRLSSLSHKYGFHIIEDACEALCAKYKNKLAGSLGDISVFSFYGNKLIASGEGGMILTNMEEAYNRMKLYRGQGQDFKRKFWHVARGFNFRMTNLQSAVALSQFYRIEDIQNKKLEIHKAYELNIPNHVEMQLVHPECEHSWWMVGVLSKDNANYYGETSQRLLDNRIETRPVFPPMPDMPIFRCEADIPASRMLYRHGILLPSGITLTEGDIKRVCSLL